MAEIVKFTGDNDALFCRESADSLHAKAQVIVPETHTVLLIKDGVVSEALKPGRHDIFDTENGLFRLKKDSDVASVDFVFVSRTAKLPMLWGTSTPIRARDPITGVPVSIGINGTLEFRVSSPKKFYLELVGADAEYSIDKLKKRLLGRLMGHVESAIASVIKEENMCFSEFTEHRNAIAEKLRPSVSDLFEREYGLELCSFSIAGAIMSDADILAIERKRTEQGGNKTCHACGAVVGENAKFCPECGERLSGVCPKCGAKLDQSARFCSHCGKRLS